MRCDLITVFNLVKGGIGWEDVNLLSGDQQQDPKKLHEALLGEVQIGHRGKVLHYEGG